MSSFPTLDAEPDRRPVWRAAIVPGAVAAGIAVVVIVVLALTGGTAPKQKPPPPPKAEAPGEVIGWNTANHTLVGMTSNGAVHPGPPLATGLPFALETAVDGAAIHIGDAGRFVSLENGRLKPTPYMFPPGSFFSTDVYGQSPFADNDQAVVVGGLEPTGAAETPSIIDLNTGDRRKLPGAPPDQVMGDPTKRGAWVTISHGLPTASTTDSEQPDSRIEYRTPGKPPVTLATAAQLVHLAGFKGNPKVTLTPHPSASGKEIAVDVLTIGHSPAPEAIVVLTRTGQVLGKIQAERLRQVAWANFSDQLLALQAPRILTTWTPGHPPTEPITLPLSLGGGWAGCVFSPNATYIVCGNVGTQVTTKWALVRLADQNVVVEAAHETPVDWSP